MDSSCFRSDFWHYIGPAFLIAMGCIDPGNISGDIATGQMTNYRLLWLLVASSVLFYHYQNLAIQLSVHSGKDISFLCNKYYSFSWSVFLYIMAEIAILAADTQEVLGTAIALNIIFGMSYLSGIVFALILAYVLLEIQATHGLKVLQIIFMGFILVMVICFGLIFSKLEHDYTAIFLGFLPFMKISDLPFGISMLGSIIMPQSLFLHSSLIANSKKINDELNNKKF